MAGNGVKTWWNRIMATAENGTRSNGNQRWRNENRSDGGRYGHARGEGEGETLKEMFPALDQVILDEAVSAHGGDVQEAIEYLLQLHSAGETTSVNKVREGSGQRSTSSAQSNYGAPQRNPHSNQMRQESKLNEDDASSTRRYPLRAFTAQDDAKSRGKSVRVAMRVEAGDGSEVYRGVIEQAPALAVKNFVQQFAIRANPDNGRRSHNITADADYLHSKSQPVSVSSSDGRIVGANEDYHRDSVVQTADSRDSGTYYRTHAINARHGNDGLAQGITSNNAENDNRSGTRAVRDKVGPIEARAVRTRSRQMTRVNPSSKKRTEPLEGYELSSIIDPARNLEEVDIRDTGRDETSQQSLQDVEADALFETAAVGAKLRNTHRVGGERIKEMDHFVASVEVPNVIVEQPDIAPLVLKHACLNSAPVQVDGIGCELYVQDEYRQNGDIDDSIKLHARAFYFVLQNVCEILELPLNELRICVLTTMRSDSHVCSRSNEDGFIYVNLLVFLQQACVDPQTGYLKRSAGRRPWVYWVQRLAMADGAVIPGLYDEKIRRRFEQMMQNFDV